MLVPIPGAHGHAYFPLAILPTLENLEWEADLLQLQASLTVPGAVAADPRLGLLSELMAENGWGQKGMVRGQRGDLERRSGRKVALISITGGLQAFNREKGGIYL
uniref:Uncharacterized protein n=1 Tax=Oncorhynchus mykiss TaxID=8022 RepID=A0A8K9V284_ONCMY